MAIDRKPKRTSSPTRTPSGKSGGKPTKSFGSAAPAAKASRTPTSASARTSTRPDSEGGRPTRPARPGAGSAKPSRTSARPDSAEARPARSPRSSAGSAKPSRSAGRPDSAEGRSTRSARLGAGPAKPSRTAGRKTLGEIRSEKPARAVAPSTKPGHPSTRLPSNADRTSRAARPIVDSAKPTRIGPNVVIGDVKPTRVIRPRVAKPKHDVVRKPIAKPRKPVRKDENQGERLQKILAHAGVASRRACEAMILEGRVQVNGVVVTELGAKAHPRRDEITLDLQPICKEEPVYILLNKPKGYVTTVKDEEGRPTVMALLHGVEARVYPVGRLDFQSEGLLLMTNDGEMAQRLTSPDNHVPKVYLVKVHRIPRPETLDEMRDGFRLDGVQLKPCGIEFHDRQDNPWLKIVLVEGKNQQIRKMFAAVGHPVHKLRRIQFGPLDDPYLKPSEWRYLNPQELAALKNL